jgi:hypothetical protein
LISAVGSDDALWVNEYVFSSGLGNWYSLGGVVSSPASLSVTVSVLGGDNKLWQRSLISSNNWSDWQQNAGVSSTPAGTDQVTSGGITYRVSEAVDGSLELDKTGSLLANLGGVVKYDPSVIALDDRLLIAAVGSDNALWINEYMISSNQGNWYSLGGYASSSTQLSVTVSVLGGDNMLWQRSFISSNNWSDWQQNAAVSTVPVNGTDQVTVDGVTYRVSRTESGSLELDKNGVFLTDLGGVVKYAPTVFALDDRLLIAAVGSDDALWVNEYVFSSGLGSWYSLGGVVSSPASLSVTVSVLGGDNKLWQRSLISSNNWSDWQQNAAVSTLQTTKTGKATNKGNNYQAIKTKTGSLELDLC